MDSAAAAAANPSLVIYFPNGSSMTLPPEGGTIKPSVLQGLIKRIHAAQDRQQPVVDLTWDDGQHSTSCSLPLPVTALYYGPTGSHLNIRKE